MPISSGRTPTAFRKRICIDLFLCILREIREITQNSRDSQILVNAGNKISDLSRGIVYVCLFSDRKSVSVFCLSHSATVSPPFRAKSGAMLRVIWDSDHELTSNDELLAFTRQRDTSINIEEILGSSLSDFRIRVRKHLRKCSRHPQTPCVVRHLIKFSVTDDLSAAISHL